MQLKNWFPLLALAALASCNPEKKPVQQENLSPMANLQNLPKSPTLGPPPLGGLNPKHGEPGHRCDIAVGAKLPSPNQQPAIPTPQPTVVQQNSTRQPALSQTAAPAVTATAKGMNPPHGQPNHRCDIAVGAPLNSKPAQNITATQPTVKTLAPTTTTVPKTNEKGQQLNPAHGQPNHRCDIAVGAPLT